ncbi:fungal-specific transcription factor domain-containing protein [Hyaloscypha variabilis F]|uniref:Fungal-specific transcription factor domain-containing protein n=1 Tax=Hyaloscypha variabilis (strain UAMH 11265 / GT02V1 / F) TaxID=1149755 RepID=A0A2J6R208_HYAVF|nr:fungal-specific transcription factor domain-containing protein [Hyaloscypha variabilis F]
MSNSRNSPVKAIKKSAFSCDPCRRRKVKCGGEQPSCGRCIARSETCLYKLSPTLTYTQTLENKVKELEHLVSELRDAPASYIENTSIEPPQSAQSSPTPDKKAISKLAGNFEGLTSDNKGRITYHGATSFFQLPKPTTHDDNPKSGPLDIPTGLDDRGSRRERLVNNAWQQRVLETSFETPEPFQFLLDVHWCWIQPLFNFVYRPAFTRDMEQLGRYYSHTLLNAMLSHSMRWCKNDGRIRELLSPFGDGNLFSRQARTLLFEELTLGHCTVPTVQTLLLLSAQECSAGNRTQAWLYSGMAFRLIEDMGICIDGQKYASTVKLSDEDIEIRHRLFWSCYFWDKLISLYLGRSPTLQHSTVSPPRILLDDSAENELWTPHGIVYPQGMGYIPTQAHSISCFMRMCQLSEIFNQILIHIYDPMGQNSEEEINNCLASEGDALMRWWQDLPDCLRIDFKALPSQCPPSHIVTLNCLYLTFKILLYRPMLFRRLSGQRRPDPSHLVECISSATAIITIFDLFRRTFGEGYCVLSLSYSVYTAASIFLLQLQASTYQDDQTLRRMKFCTGVLERVKIFNPVIENSLALIIQALSKLGIDLTTPVIFPDPVGLQDPSITKDTDITPVNHPMIPGNEDFEMVDGFQAPYLDSFNLDGFEISTELLDAFLSLEPIDATVGGLRDFD